MPPLPLPLRRKLAQALLLLAPLTLASSATRAAAPASTLLSQLSLARPFPALEEFARANHVPLRTFAAAESRAIAPGDRVVLLVDLNDGRRRRQWLVELTAAELNDAERNQAPPPDLVMTMNNHGGELRFSNQHRLALEVVVAGPAGPATLFADLDRTVGRALLSPDLLAVGLDDSCRMTIRFKTVPANYTPTLEEQRAGMGFFPALLTFMQTMQSTPGLRDVLWAVVEKPSLWSIARHAGRVDTMINVGKEVAPAPAEDWAYVAPTDTFSMPVDLTLNEQSALVAELFVTSPRPPLVACAGIVGVRAHSPKHSERHVDIRVIGTAAGR